jgi:hypothetical protein
VDVAAAKPTKIRQMRISVTDPRQLDEVIEFLESEPAAIVERVSETELEVSLLGSYAADAMQMQLELRLRAWEAGRAAGRRIEIVD